MCMKGMIPTFKHTGTMVTEMCIMMLDSSILDSWFNGLGVIGVGVRCV